MYHYPCIENINIINKKELLQYKMYPLSRTLKNG